jgi:hypothetical protein
MAADNERECFNNPLILYSEHKRVLTDAIKRGDERAREAEKRGYYHALAEAMWAAVITCLIGAAVGFNVGMSYTPDDQSNICVPLYDNTGFERCQ